MRLDKDYNQIHQDILNEKYLMLKPMDVRRLLKLRTEVAYALFDDPSFPSTKVGGKNYIITKKFIEWFEDRYSEQLS